MNSLTEEMIAEFREAFETFDTDKDGQITIEDLVEIFKMMNVPPTQPEIEHMKEEVDVDQNGTIDFKEYITLLARRVRDVDLEEETVEAFRIFDRNDDGLISTEELKAIMYVLSEKIVGEVISEEDLNLMMKEADTDEDGYINYKEFIEVLKKH